MVKMREIILSGKESGQCKRGSGESSRVVVGGSADGGAAGAYCGHPDDSVGLLGFRVAVVLSLKQEKMWPASVIGVGHILYRGFDPATKHSTYFLYLRFKYEIFFIIQNL